LTGGLLRRTGGLCHINPMESGFELSAKDEIGISANPAASGALGDGCHLPK